MRDAGGLSCVPRNGVGRAHVEQTIYGLSPDFPATRLAKSYGGPPHLTQRRDVARHDLRAAGKRFNDGKAEPLPVGRHQHQSRAAVDRGQHLSRQER
jgi:hypothetical protein